MNNKMESIPFIDSPEKHAKLEAIIAEHKTMRGALVQVLKLAQEVYGYLPLEVQEQVAEGLDLPLEELKQFSPMFEQDVYDAISMETCVGQRAIPGGPAPAMVQATLDDARAFLASLEQA